MKERRSDERIPDDIPALFARSIGDPDIQAGSVRNLSDGGACVAMRKAQIVGAEIYVGFFLRRFGGAPLIAKMRIAWTKAEGDGYLVGLAFLADGATQLDAVKRMRDYLAVRRRELLAAV